jgi:hypothetical protein
MIEELIHIDAEKKIRTHRLISGEQDNEKCIYIYHYYTKGYFDIKESKDKLKRRNPKDEAFLLDANRFGIKLLKIHNYEMEQKRGK